jgi:hypothetical protein
MELGEAQDLAEMAFTRDPDMLKSVSAGLNPADWRPASVCRRRSVGISAPSFSGCRTQWCKLFRFPGASKMLCLGHLQRRHFSGDLVARENSTHVPLGGDRVKPHVRADVVPRNAPAIEI